MACAERLDKCGEQNAKGSAQGEGEEVVGHD
jgi:hypothetical protein